MLKSKTTRFIGLYIAVLLAIAVRVIYWMYARNEAWFVSPGMDPAFYSGWAEAIIQGRGGDYLPFPRAPLYPYLLAIIRLVFGDYWLLIRLLNLFADLFTIIMIFFLTRLIASEKAALYAALLYALSGAAIYFSGEILMTSLAAAFSIGFVYTLAVCWKKPHPVSAALAGLILALASLLRPNILVVLPFSLLILYFRTRHVTLDIKQSFMQPSVHLIAFLIVLAPVTFLNYKASGRLIPISTQGGVNFYIGNAKTANGWASELPGIGANWDDNDALRVAEREVEKPLTMYEASGQLYRMGIKEIKADPFRWMKLELKKLFILLNIREIGNNRPLSLPVETFPPLKILFILSLGLMFPLALAGIHASYRSAEIKAMLLFLILFGGSLLFFFVNTRYRMPLLPVMVCLSGVGMADIIANLIKRVFSFKKLGLIAAGFAISLPPWIGTGFNDSAQAYFVAGNALLRQERALEALGKYRQTEEIDPGYRELHLNIGVALLALGDTLGAEKEFHHELSHHPANAKAENNLGVIAEKRNNLGSAELHYIRSLASNSEMDDARINLGRVLLKSGDLYFQSNDIEQAERYYHKAGDYLDSDPRPPFRLALVRASVNDWAGAERHLEEALDLDEKYEPALELWNKIVGEKQR